MNRGEARVGASFFSAASMPLGRRFPTWGEIFKQPEDVRGETMQGLIKALAHERTTNDRKVRLVKQAYVLLVVGVALAAAQAATLAVTGLL